MPDLSPDGKHMVAYAIDVTKEQPAQQDYDVLISQDAAGEWSSIRRLTPSNEAGSWARWSPDGRSIAYVGNRATIPGTAQLQPAAGGQSRAVYDGRPLEGVTYIAWGKAPNVLYVDTRDSTARYNFYAVPLNSGKPRLLFRDSADHRVGRADFATDGRRLFVTIAADESDVYTMELNRQ